MDEATPLLYRLLGLLVFNLADATSWSPHHYLLWAVVIAGALELLSALVLAGGRACGLDAPSQRLKPGGPALETLSATDSAYIAVNKVVTAAFSYHAVRYAWLGGVVWGRATLGNCLLALPALYVAYDAFYTPFHRALHHASVYAWVHKHHHRQIAPFRGNVDAINVHPLEFALGEYNHLLAIALVGAGARAAGAALPPAAAAALGLGPAEAGVHAAAAGLFVLAGGVLASLNHTRFDARGGWGAYAVAYHDIHHHLYKFNYCQYVPVFDLLGGTFRAGAAGEGKGGCGGKAD